MGVYDELKARGMIAQTTHEEEVKDLLNNKKCTFYIGFDPTADSLHVGHFVTVMTHANSPVWRRHRKDRRPVRQDRYAQNDDGGNDRLQRVLLCKADVEIYRFW